MSGLIHERTAEQKAVDALVLARVKRGIALLEEKYGDDWWRKIDLDELDLADSQMCVLGQLYGGYSIGCGRLGLAWSSDDECFADTLGAGFVDSGDEYEALQEVWEREIAERQR